MHIWKELAGASVAFGIAIVLTPSAEAQSFFQKLFGFTAPAQPPPINRQLIPPQRFQSHGAFRSRAQPVHAGDDEIGPPDSGGPYKTLCVRTCDGFYFPIRSAAMRRNFSSDVKSCRNACGDEARLYYYAVNGPEGPDAMVDLGGKKYMELPHALAYRKELVSGCSCKPAPWSAEEAARHKGYADQEAIEVAKDEAFLKARAAAVAGETPSPQIDATANAAEDVTEAVDTSTPAEQQLDVVSRNSDATASRRAQRQARVKFYRVRYRPTSSTAIYAGGRTKYVWQRTRR